MPKPKILLSFFDHSGNSSRPWKEGGWEVIQIDIKNGHDILEFDYENERYLGADIFIIAQIPCTAYALCGNKHKHTEGRKEIFKASQVLVERTRIIIDYFNSRGNLKGWMVENPMSDIHKKNIWLGEIKQKFNPCDFAGYDPNPDASRYNKQTWLWGNFKLMELNRMEPLEKANPGWKKLGGKSERTKELRSVTPFGFAYAFYEANK